MRTRARRNFVGASMVAAVGLLLFSTLGATPAMANAASPSASPIASGSVVQNANGTVTVTASGRWLWAFGTESATTAGLDATVNHPCDTRTGVGWGIVWNDPNDPGFTETYINKHGTPAHATVHVGSQGINPLNGDDQVEYNGLHKCGTFIQTNVPKPGDGYDTGIWTGTHVYASAAALPSEVCVITYDLGFAKPPSPHRTSFDNNDNSVQWSLFKQGTWNTATMGVNCSQLPPPVPAPPVVTPPAPPTPIRTVSHTPRPTPKVPAAVKPATRPLAFTGFGQIGRLVALLGTILIMLGLVLYFLDVRRGALWLLGSDLGAPGVPRFGVPLRGRGTPRPGSYLGADPARRRAPATAAPRPGGPVGAWSARRRAPGGSPRTGGSVNAWSARRHGHGGALPPPRPQDRRPPPPRARGPR